MARFSNHDLNFDQSFTARTPRIVNAAKLLRPAGRKKQGLVLAEGANSVEAAVVSALAQEIYVTEAAFGHFQEIITAAGHMEIPVFIIDDSAAKHLSDTVTTTGLFAVCRPLLWDKKDVLGKRPKLVAVPVQASDPGNAGTIIRVSDAVGADAVLFAGETVDPQSPKALRSSAGSIFHIPTARDTDVNAALDRLHAKGLNLLATAADGEVDLDDADDLLAQPTAWLFGNEAHGLPDEVLSRADYRVRIPIRGRAESLNLATAASICLYESAKALYRAEQEEQPSDQIAGDAQADAQV